MNCACNIQVGDNVVSRQMDTMFRTAFKVDKEILEAIDHVERQAQGRHPRRLGIGKSPVVH